MISISAREAVLVKALEEIVEHCANAGLPNEIVADRVVDRCDETARDALSEFRAPPKTISAATFGELVEAMSALIDDLDECTTYGAVATLNLSRPSVSKARATLAKVWGHD